ncbi:MAG: type II toxin-antitoxin system HicA family toxin [bacterium]
MARIIPLHWRKLSKIFELDGWNLDRISGDHLVFIKQDFIRPIVIPKEKEVQVFIIKNNLKTAKISREKYFNLLKIIF